MHPIACRIYQLLQSLTTDICFTYQYATYLFQRRANKLLSWESQKLIFCRSRLYNCVKFWIFYCLYFLWQQYFSSIQSPWVHLKIPKWPTFFTNYDENIMIFYSGGWRKNVCVSIFSNIYFILVKIIIERFFSNINPRNFKKLSLEPKLFSSFRKGQISRKSHGSQQCYSQLVGYAGLN